MLFPAGTRLLIYLDTSGAQLCSTKRLRWLSPRRSGVASHSPAMSCGGSCSLQGLSLVLLDFFKTRESFHPHWFPLWMWVAIPVCPAWLFSVDLRLELGDK